MITAAVPSAESPVGRTGTVRTPSARRPPTVLVVDHDPCMRDLLRIHLSNAGYKVTTAEDAAVALKCLMHRVPNLMIADMNMPYMDGLEFVRAVKSDPALSRMPILFLTASTDADEAAARVGAIGCLKKPLPADELIAAAQAAAPIRRLSIA